MMIITPAGGSGTVTYTTGTPTDDTASGGALEIDDANGNFTIQALDIDRTTYDGTGGSARPAALVIAPSGSPGSVINAVFKGAGSHLTNTYSNLAAFFIGTQHATVTVDTSKTSSGNVFAGYTGIESNAGLGTSSSLNLTTGAADIIISVVDGGDGIYIVSDASTLVNNATIEGDSSGDNFSTGIAASTTGADNITNNGSVTATYGAIYGAVQGGTAIVTIVNTGSAEGGMVGIVTGNTATNITTISNGVSAGTKAAIVSGNTTGIQMGTGGTITNFPDATISGGTASIALTGTGDTVNNYGTLTGSVTFGGHGVNTLNNYGTLTGGVSVTSGYYGGNVNLFAGSTVTGTVDLSGSGSNHIITLYTGTASAAAASVHAIKGNSLTELDLAGDGTGAGGNAPGGVLDPTSVTGVGKIVEIGTGTWTISAADPTFAIALTVNAGTLSVNGSVASAVAVNTGGSLGGDGTVGTTTLVGGTLTPAGSGIGTLNITGDLSLDGNSTYDANVAAGSADSINVSGIATLAGMLSVNYAGGSYDAGTYTLLSAAGGLSGAFDGLSSSDALPAGYSASLIYDDDDVYLTLTADNVAWGAHPPGHDWNTGANWQTGGVPGAMATAEFGATDTASVIISQATSAQAIEIDAGAPAYSFAITGGSAGAAGLSLSDGIADFSANSPSFVVGGVSGDAGTLTFTSAGNAADAAITAARFGTILFQGMTDAGANANLLVKAGGAVDFSGTAGALGNDQVSVGSLAGEGRVVLGANDLTLGALNLSSQITGIVSGTGGLIKTGSGTLTLAGHNLYSGGTDIDGGTLELADTHGAGAGTITFSGANTVLRIDTSAMPANIIAGFAPGDIIDLTGLAFNSADTVSVNGAQISIGAAGVTDVLTLASANDLSGYAITLSQETGGAGSTITLSALAEQSNGTGTKLTGGGDDSVYIMPGTLKNLSFQGTGNFTGTGNALDNQITGNAGDDVIAGGTGDDTLDGGTGNDTLIGGNGADILTGDDGNDVLSGGNGNDLLVGGAGMDTLTGGAGADRFRFNAAGDSTVSLPDVITDFSTGQGDRIDFSKFDAALTKAGSATLHLGGNAFTHSAGEVIQFSSGGNTMIAGDLNGDGMADFAIQLNGSKTLSHLSFIF